MGKGIPGRPRFVDSVRVVRADQHDLTSYANATAKLEQLEVPLLGSDEAREARLYVAAFDGTGNSLFNDELPTNVGLVASQLGEEVGGNRTLGYDYLEGIGTQDNVLVRVADQAIGATYDSKIEEMYVRFIRKAAEWRRQDPSAEISLAGIGFSRGAVQAAGFARLVHERGIQDPDGMRHVRGDDGRMELVFTKPPLVPPGQVPQVLGLFDPVATGIPALDDVRIPPSVLSAFQISAEDERRDWFPGMDIVPRGLSDDGRFLNVVVGGAHCDIGGGYRLDGLSVRSGNLMADYLNALSDRPLLAKRAVPEDPAMNVVHRSEDHLPIYSTLRFRFGSGRTHMPPADGSLLCSMGFACADPDPVDRSLASRFDYRPVAIGPVPVVKGPETGGPSKSYEAVMQDVQQLFERLATAAGQRDAQAMRSSSQAFLATDAGRDWRDSGQRHAESPAVPSRQAETAEHGFGIDTPRPVQSLRL